MRKKSLTETAYKQLSPKERFAAAMKAISRQDDEELERLGRSCPRVTYRMADADYIERLEQSRLAATCFSLLWLDAAQRYRLATYAGECYVGAMRGQISGYLRGASSAWKRAGHKKPLFDIDGGEPSVEELDEIGFAAAIDSFPQRYEKRRRELACEVKAIYTGFVRFCKKVQVEPETLLAWYPPILSDIEDLRGLLENADIEPDQELATRLFEALLSSWPPN